MRSKPCVSVVGGRGRACSVAGGAGVRASVGTVASGIAAGRTETWTCVDVGQEGTLLFLLGTTQAASLSLLRECRQYLYLRVC